MPGRQLITKSYVESSIRNKQSRVYWTSPTSNELYLTM